MTIAVGLSGGIDSSIAACLLRDQGHEVIGLTMKLYDGTGTKLAKKTACFGPGGEDNIEDARRLCRSLGVPHHVIDLSREYNETVLAYFREEYLRGRTPNPCLKCNRHMKFGLLIEKAWASGIRFDKYATGHYALTVYHPETGRYLLKKGVDVKKEQSYFLALLRQEQLERAVFPLGGLTKDDVRRMAREKGLPVLAKKESQDFYRGDYADLFEKRPEAGDIVDKNGTILGKHRGICFYTIGQRRGLGVSHSEPLYVVGIDKAANRIVVGTEGDLYSEGLIARNLNWISMPGPCGGPLRLKARIRYLHTEQPATVTAYEAAGIAGDGALKTGTADEPSGAGMPVRVVFDRPQRAVTPGQFVVLYDGDTVAAGGIIERSF
ncbi:MAG: tRNA 2-thiouridine(34) synthase MnmA [Spirochaetales bacterium]|nr:tRNA 2-thiouridine(34) synthase MnmA [Spirochaetales bacterium]